MTLSEQVERWCPGSGLPNDVTSLLVDLTSTAERLYDRLRSSEDGTFVENGTRNSTGDAQTRQDRISHQFFMESLSASKVVSLCISEESDQPVRLGNGPLSVAIDPFDGSKAWAWGIPAGTIVTFFREADNVGEFSGRNAVFTGIFLYSHTLELIATADDSVAILDPNRTRSFSSLGDKPGFVCFNVSNFPFWDKGWQGIVENLLLESQSGRHANMRWFGSLALHAKATLLGGGLFGYPPDPERPEGHLRLIYEAIPVAHLMSKVGGASTNGEVPILDVIPNTTHQRTPLAFGSPELVMAVQETLRKCRRERR